METILKNKRIISFIFLICLFFNLYLPTMRSDDIVYLNRVNDMGYIGASIDHYFHWSSRIIIEFILMFFSQHFLLWKFANSLFMTLGVCLLCDYIFKNITKEKLLLVFSIYCLVPLTVMGESGWLATTLNYHWPWIGILIAFYPFLKRIRGEECPLLISILSLICLFFSANHEQFNLCYFCLTFIVSIYLFRKKRYAHKLIYFSLLSLVEFLLSILSPGNENRLIHEIHRLPQYQNFGFINKLDLGIASFGKPFFLDFNVLFLILFSLIFWLGYKNSSNLYQKILLGFPLILNLIIYIGTTIPKGFLQFSGNGRTLIWNTEHLNTIFSVEGTKLSLYYPGTWRATFLILFLSICLCIGIWQSFNERDLKIFAVLLYWMAFFSRIMLGFSPTVWASGIRAYYIVYMVGLILVLMLLKELSKIINLKRFEKLEYVMTLLGLCTFLLTILCNK